MVLLDGGPFLMGTDAGDGFPSDGEGPIREVTLSPFWIDPRPITNERFARFIDATGFVTVAEQEGWSFVFQGLLPEDFEDTSGVVGAEWWRQVFGATWRHPEGPHSHVDDRGDHPVVHVSWSDAQAYCAWAGLRLPTEAEWEFAARGGLEQARYAWGDDLTPDAGWMCNIWQGTFPSENTLDDGFLGTAPVGSFPPNAFGMCDMAGNTWDWVNDWFGPTFGQAPQRDPLGPSTGDAKVIRGGSYLCHDSYCNRYRVAARTSNEPASSTGNMGFRCARDV
jgi:formylglycine-generating enzyme required for sulfatase activity